MRRAAPGRRAAEGQGLGQGLVAPAAVAPPVAPLASTLGREAAVEVLAAEAEAQLRYHQQRQRGFSPAGPCLPCKWARLFA